MCSSVFIFFSFSDSFPFIQYPDTYLNIALYEELSKQDSTTVWGTLWTPSNHVTRKLFCHIKSLMLKWKDLTMVYFCLSPSSNWRNKFVSKWLDEWTVNMCKGKRWYECSAQHACLSELTSHLSVNTKTTYLLNGHACFECLCCHTCLKSFVVWQLDWGWLTKNG